MDLEHLLYETEGPIASITLNRPERMNAITGQTMSEIGEALARIQADDTVSVAEASSDKIVGAVRPSEDASECRDPRREPTRFTSL